MNHQNSKEISDIKIIDINRHKDSRGYLYESYRKKSFLKKLIFAKIILLNLIMLVFVDFIISQNPTPSQN